MWPLAKVGMKICLCAWGRDAYTETEVYTGVSDIEVVPNLIPPGGFYRNFRIRGFIIRFRYVSSRPWISTEFRTELQGFEHEMSEVLCHDAALLEPAMHALASFYATGAFKRLATADNEAYSKDAVLSALMDAVGNEQRALELLRTDGEFF